MSDNELQTMALRPAAPAPLEEPPGPSHDTVSPWYKLHRLLRGRYPWAILLAILGMAGGGVGGWMSQQPLYRGIGLIYIKPSVQSPQDPEGRHVPPMFRGFVMYQVVTLLSPTLTHMAVRTDAWEETGRGTSRGVVNGFVARRSVSHARDTQHIEIQFMDEDPEVAVAGVVALMEAYGVLSKMKSEEEVQYSYAKGKVDELSKKLRDEANQILEITRQYGGVDALEMLHLDAVTKMLKAKENLEIVRGLIRDLDTAGHRAEAPRAQTAVEISLQSAEMTALLTALADLEAQAEILAESVVEGHPRMVALRSNIRHRKKQIDAFVNTWNERLMRELTDAEKAEASREQLLAREENFKEDWLALQNESNAIGKDRMAVNGHKAVSEDMTRELEQMSALQDQLETDIVGSGRIKIPSPEDLPTPTAPFRDRRMAHAVAGAFVGGVLGILIVLLIGLLDRKLRDPGDLDSDLSRTRLLGLLPTLPLDLSDPQAGQMAIHCVHQIRTLLRIGHVRDRGASICITGSSVGSGKTTLATALGLSFGSSGSRTLVIDADLEGRGMTRRIGQMLLSRVRRAAGVGGLDGLAGDECLEGPEGPSSQVLAPLVAQREKADRPEPEELAELLAQSIGRQGYDAARESGLVEDIFSLAGLLFSAEECERVESRVVEVLDQAGRVHGVRGNGLPPRTLELDPGHIEFNGTPLNDYLFRTGVDALQFLPLRGIGRGGQVSVSTISKILARVREEFDVVLVDTGPVLGAVETSMVAAQSDCVVMVVSPGDQRPIATRSVEHLRQIGANLAGVVFNRAGRKDVLQSSMSYYSGGGETQD